MQHLQKSSNEVTELYSKIKDIEDKLAVSEREQITLKSEMTLWKEKFTNEQVRFQKMFFCQTHNKAILEYYNELLSVVCNNKSSIFAYK